MSKFSKFHNISLCIFFLITVKIAKNQENQDLFKKYSFENQIFIESGANVIFLTKIFIKIKRKEIYQNY